MDKKKKKGKKNMHPGTVQGATLREENTGKKRVSASSMSRMQHLQSLATWASVEVGIPALGALLGHRLAASAETEGVPLDPSTFVCRRCESILRPGFNCSVRIEKNTKKTQSHKKPHSQCQNNVVYKCHFCSHHNLLKGTHKGYLKGLCPPKSQPDVNSNIHDSLHKSTISPENRVESTKKFDLKEGSLFPKEPTSQVKSKLPESVATNTEISLGISPLTPLLSKKKRNTSASNKASSESGNSSIMSNSVEVTGGSSKRKRKGWSSLKQIAETNELRTVPSISKFAIHFC